MAFSDVTPHSRYLIIKIARNSISNFRWQTKKKIAKKIAKNIAFFGFLLI
jgi:hypothetical protein